MTIFDHFYPILPYFSLFSPCKSLTPLKTRFRSLIRLASPTLRRNGQPHPIMTKKKGGG